MAQDGVAGGSGSRERWWRGLAARAALVVGAMLVVLATLLITMAASGVRETAAHAIEVTAAAEADQIASDLANGRRTVDEVAARLLDPRFAYGFLARPDGALIAGRQPAQPGAQPSVAALAETEASPAATMIESRGLAHAAKAVSLPDGERAVLRFAVPLASADEAGRDAAAEGLLAALAFFVLALPALALAVDRAASPLRALTRAVARPGASDDEVAAAGSRRDEIGALARAHLAIARDLAENADALHRLTFDDPLTRLPNRESLTSRLAVALQLGQKLALAKIEVEGLSRVAAGLGQQTGDETIKAAARRLSIVATAWSRGRRLEGEQPVMLSRISDFGFVLLAAGADGPLATSLAKAVLAAFEEPLEVGEHRVMATLSVGVALAPEDGDEAAVLLRSASAALSAARAVGPQTVRMAGAELNRMAYGRLRLEQDLRRAIETRELELHFQPKVSLKTGSVSGAEALVRWRHPVRGMISPAEFVPIAEECGLVEPLGRFVLGEASRMSALWAKKGIELTIAVNVSPLQFRKPRFAETMLEIIRAAGATPSRIELEITESAAMGDPEHAVRELALLKEVGVRVAIDDFGTGYSNLAALTRLPIDVLKIDRGFVNEAGARVVVGTVISMAKTLGFETVAEGVETAEQLDFVTSHGCTHAQGFLFGRPMPADVFEGWYGDRLVTELRSMGSRGRDERQPAPRSVIEPSRRSV